MIVTDYKLDPPDVEPLACVDCGAEPEEWVYLALESEPDGFPGGVRCMSCLEVTA